MLARAATVVHNPPTHNPIRVSPSSIDALGRYELSHHAIVLMLKNVAVVHERCFHGRLGETHEKLNGVKNETPAVRPGFLS